MKHILFVIPSFEIGGVISSLHNFLQVIDSNNCKISIFAMSHQGECKSLFPRNIIMNKIPLLHLWFCRFSKASFYETPILVFLKVIRRLSLILKVDIERFICCVVAQRHLFRQYDTIIAFQEGDVTKFVSFIKHSTKIAWIHCDMHYAGINHNEFVKYYSSFNKIVAVSRYIQDAFSDLYPMCVDKMEYIYNVTSRNLLLKKSEEFDPSLSLVSHNDQLIVSIGRFSMVKQFEKIPDIARKLRCLNPYFKWFIVGCGLEDEEQNIKKEILRCGMQDVVFTVGFKSNVAPILRRADAYVCTSYSEACPMVFLEANALDTYVISNEFPSAHEFLDGKNGKITNIENMPNVINDFLCHERKKNLYNPIYLNDSIRKFKSLVQL